MKDQTIDEFLLPLNACKEGLAYVRASCPTGMMSEVYDFLSKDESKDGKDYFDWLWCRSFDDRTLRLLAVRFVRETPLSDGHKVADLLDDPRSLKLLTIAERFADGKATRDELNSARDAARDAARASARASAWEAQKKMILELGNPFKGTI